MIEENFGEHKI